MKRISNVKNHYTYDISVGCISYDNYYRSKFDTFDVSCNHTCYFMEVKMNFKYEKNKNKSYSFGSG